MFQLLYCIVTKAVKLEEFKKAQVQLCFYYAFFPRLDYIPNNTSLYKKNQGGKNFLFQLISINLICQFSNNKTSIT